LLNYAIVSGRYFLPSTDMNPPFFVDHSLSHNSTNFEIGCRNSFVCNILVKFIVFH